MPQILPSQIVHNDATDLPRTTPGANVEGVMGW
jgi:hypothetical protein